MRIGFLLLLLFTVQGAAAQVEISGTAKNYKDSVFYIMEHGGFDNFTKAWRDNRVKVTIDSTGHFRVTVPETAIGSWSIRVRKNYSQIFDLVKGENLELVADFSKRDPLTAIGKNEADFNYSLFFNKQTSDYYEKDNYLQKIRLKNIDSVLAYRKTIMDFKMNLLAEYVPAHSMSTVYRNWLTAKYKYEPYERTIIENIKIDSVDEATVNKIMPRGMSDEYAALHTAAYNAVIDFYVTWKAGKNPNWQQTLRNWFSLVADGNLLKGSTRDMYLTRFLNWQIMLADSVYDPLFSKYDKLVQDKTLKQMVISRRNDYKNPVQSSTPVDSIAGSLGAIFSKYKGKVIYVDFWASWCLPCRGEMPNAAELKNKLKGKDIVFLYFGYKDTERAWLKAREQLNVEGEHYLLNESLMKEAEALFGVNSIPHYAIIDKNGRIVSKQADRPGYVYSQLAGLLLK
jgi:thiol-disulfide isomerase/thioredoxin